MVIEEVDETEGVGEGGAEGASVAFGRDEDVLRS